MKKLFENMFFQLALVNVLFFATLAAQWAGALIWFGYFICWLIIKKNES